MKMRFIMAALTLVATLVVTASLLHAQTIDVGLSAANGNVPNVGLRPGSPDMGGKVKNVPVQQLSNRVEKLIRIVESSTLPCDTRNVVVRRLRKLDDALLSERRSAARSLVQAWRRDAWSLEAARLIGPDIGSSLQNQLSGLRDNIGYGWSEKPGPTRHWKPLPSCDSEVAGVTSSSADLVGGSYNPAITDPSSDAKAFLKMAFGTIPEIGGFLNGLVDLLWPAGSTADDNGFKELVDEATYDLVAARLQGLMSLMSSADDTGWNDQVAYWKQNCDHPPQGQPNFCTDYANNTLWDSFGRKFDAFKNEGPTFQQSGHELALLPLYAQYENLFMSLLRDGMMLHDQYWSKVSGTDTDDMAGKAMAFDLNPGACPQGTASTECRGIGYVNRIYNAGLPSSNWAARNAYIRNETLNVLDYRDIWKFMDPRAYPLGVPGGVRLTRMIYSDPVGTIQAAQHFPANVAGPLKETSLWTVRVNQAIGVSYLWIGAVQATAPPLLGPAQSGAITGYTSQSVNHAHYFNLSALGPITSVDAQVIAQFYSGTSTLIGYFPRWVQYNFATGAKYSAGDHVSGTGTCTFPLTSGCSTTIKYEGEVLATAQSVSGGYGQADTVVFGFRYPDSYNPAGEAIGVASGKCLDATSWTNGSPAMIWSCANPPSVPQIWTYDPHLQQLSFTTPSDNAKHCLDADGGGTLAGTRVIFNACDNGAVSRDTGASSQRWAIEGVSDGTARITNVKSALVVTPLNDATTDGTGLSLESYAGASSQQWQAHDPWTGEIHGIGSGRCVDVPNSSTTPGTQVQIFDCGGNAAQQWTYNPTSKALIYAMAPQLCLEARGGATTSGTAVQINTCTGAPEQQWTIQAIAESHNVGGGGVITNVKSGLVLDVSGGATANHTLLQLVASNSTEAQQWSRTSSQGGALFTVAAGKCLDLPSGTQPVIHSCYNPPMVAQTWTYHPIAQTYTITSGSTTMCLGASDAQVRVQECSGASSQQWSRDAGSYTVTNVASGLVLDLSGGATSDGTPVLLTPLNLDEIGMPLPTTTQRWVWSLD